MENLMWFAATVSVYSVVWCWIQMPKKLVGYAQRAGLLALLCAPVNINGNVFTMLGNAVSEKNVFSVCSLYQKAGQNAVTFFGLSGYQSAGQDAVTFFGLSGYQSAGQDAMTGIGLAIYQRAGEKTRSFGAFTRLSAK